MGVSQAPALIVHERPYRAHHRPRPSPVTLQDVMARRKAMAKLRLAAKNGSLLKGWREHLRLKREVESLRAALSLVEEQLTMELQRQGKETN
jgi:hypothetical protein